MEMVGEEGAFVFTSEEVLTDDELRTSLKVIVCFYCTCKMKPRFL